MRKMYGAKDKKILSVIQEEIKGSQEVTPPEIVAKTPYYQNVIFGENKNVLYYCSHNEKSFENPKESQKHLSKIL